MEKYIRNKIQVVNKLKLKYKLKSNIIILYIIGYRNQQIMKEYY